MENENRGLFTRSAIYRLVRQLVTLHYGIAFVRYLGLSYVTCRIGLLFHALYLAHQSEIHR